MIARIAQVSSAIVLAIVLYSAPTAAGEDGIVNVKSAHPIGETIRQMRDEGRGKPQLASTFMHIQIV